MLDHGTPRNETETNSVLEHGEAAAREPERSAIRSLHSRSVNYGPVRESGFFLDRLRSRFNLPGAKCCQQIPHEHESLPPPLGKSLSDQELASLPECVTHFSTKALGGDACTAGYELLI